MTWMVHTGCRYHNQDTSYYCGAAAAMMILNEIGVPYTQLDQDDLYNSNHNNNRKTSGWATDPYGLEYTLDTRRPINTNGFAPFFPLSEPAGSRKIVETLHTYEVSPAALINGCQHWIVIPGVQTDVEPGENQNYTIQGFWIHNPVYHAGDPPPPHDGTDTCGSGGANGESNDWVSNADWQNMFTGCDYDDPQGRLQYISVCDPKEPTFKLPNRVALEYLADGRRLLNADETIKFSQEGLKKYALREDKRIGPALRGTEPEKPRMVLRLDQPNSYYYVVPWMTKEGISAITRIDARFGTFLGVHLPEKPSKQYRYLASSELLDKMANKRFELKENRGRVRLFPEATTVSSTLVWRPCPESYNPSMPFYQMWVGDYTFYVRVDGEIFTQLTIKGIKGD